MKPSPEGGLVFEHVAEVLAARYAVDTYADEIGERLLVGQTLEHAAIYLEDEVKRDVVSRYSVQLDVEQADIALRALDLVATSKDPLSANSSRAMLDSFDRAVWGRVQSP